MIRREIVELCGKRYGICCDSVLKCVESALASDEEETATDRFYDGRGVIMNTRFKMKLLLVIGLVLLCVFGGATYYFTVYVKTPEYAVKAIQSSIDGHDVKKFHEYVDVDTIADTSYDEFTAGVMAVRANADSTTLTAVREFGQLIKKPIISAFKTAVDGYVQNGSWDTGDTDNDIDTKELIGRTGLADVVLKDKKPSVTIDDADESLAHILLPVVERESGDEFNVELLMKKTDKGWMLTGVTNTADYMAFVNRAKKQRLIDFLDELSAINSSHDQNIQEFEYAFQKIMATGSLGKQSTRDELKQLMEDKIKKDWQERRTELSNLSCPREASDIQRLYVRICDLYIDYATGYATWMTDKKASTIANAESRLKQARTLESEARFLLNRMIQTDGGVSDDK